MKFRRIISAACTAAMMSAYVIPAEAAQSSIILYEGEITADAWTCPVTIPVYDRSIYAEGNRIAIQCDAESAPYFALTSTSGGKEWAQVAPDSSEGNWYYYSYEAMADAFGTDFSKLDYVNVMAGNSTMTLYTIEMQLEKPIEIPEPEYEKVQHNSRVVGYLPDWAYYTYSSMDLSALTHINIAFCIPDSDGNLKCNIPSYDMKNIVNRAHEYDVKVMAGLGGGGGCDNYLPLIDTPEEMAAFNEEIMDYCETYDLDGIDLDIELGSSHQIWTYYEDWVASLRTLCDERGYELSTATAQWVAVNVSPETFGLFDFVNVMAYDNDADESSHADMEFAESSLEYFNIQKKIPKEKLVLGVPFYGRGYTEDGKLDWNSYVPFAKLIEYDKANYDADLYDGIAYNGASTMREKCKMAQDHGGIMIWELTQDAAGEYSLLSLIKDEMTTSYDELLPDWVPRTFAEALNFSNKYGKNHVADGLICCVRKEQNDKDNYEIDAGTSTAEYELLYHEVFDPLSTEVPDESDTEAYEKYLEELDLLGISIDYVGLIQADFRYEVYVYKPLSEGTISLDWSAGFGISNPYAVMHFDISADGKITQTDLMSIVPDSVTEHSAFRKENDEVTIQNGHIVYCDVVAKGAGYELQVEQCGSGRVGQVMEYEVIEDSVLPPPPGTTGETVMVYEPCAPGIVRMTFTQLRPWEEDIVFSEIVKYFLISEDGEITEITEKESGIKLGDCNLDGEFSIADAVMLQKWLVGSGELTCWYNADFDSDMIVDVFDLVNMKKALTEI